MNLADLSHEDRISLKNQLCKFVVVTASGYWGKGDTLQQAIDNAKKEGARRKDKCVAWIGTEDMIFDGHYMEATLTIQIGKVNL